MKAVPALRGAVLLAVLALSCASDGEAAQYEDGAAVFSASCSVCHGARGAGTPGIAPPLLANPARYATLPEGRRQLALTVLYGMFGDITVEQKHYNFKMPEFPQLEDARLAAVLNYVVFELAHAESGVKPIEASEIAAERSKGLDGSAVREHRMQLIEALGGS
jgi:mono/diheme cytochrome c family protein